MRTYIGTRNGVYLLGDGGLTRLGLNDHRVWAIHAWEGGDGNDVVLVGTYGAGIYRSDDGGGNWQEANAGLAVDHLRTIQPGPAGNEVVFAGSEPARVFSSIDGGRNWSEFTSIRSIAGVEDWFLPYSPRAGAVRNFAWSKDGDVYAAVEVGGLLHSNDRGETWRLIEIDPGPRVHDDVHQIIVDPLDNSRLIVALGGALVDRSHRQWAGSPRRIGGVAVSEDQGRTWTKIERDYTRAVLIPSRHPEWLIAAPAERTDHGGWVSGSLDRGRTWTRIDSGISTPMDDMVERFVESPDGRVWAVCSGGRLFVAESDVWEWTNALTPDYSGVVVDSIAFAGN